MVCARQQSELWPLSESNLSAAVGADTARAARFVAGVGSAVALCILGDSLMYSILPLAAPELGIGLPLVGVLLSANRLIRLLSNSWAGALFERWGPRRPFTGATLLSLLTTTVYALGGVFTLFLAARMGWGIAWSALRQGGYTAVWTGSSRVKGRLTGLLWGLVRFGSAMSVLVGGVLFDNYGYRAAVGAIAATTALAIPVALLLPWDKMQPHRDGPQHAQGVTSLRSGWRDAFSQPLRRALTLAAMASHLVNGIVLSTTSLFLAARLDGSEQFGLLGVGALSGFMLGTRWMSDMFLGPAFGYLSDRIGQANTAFMLVLVYAAGILGVTMLPTVAAVAALLLVFICDGGIYVALNAAAGGAALHAPSPHRFVAVFTTAADGGSALGPLLAFSLAEVVGLSTLYLAGGGVLLFMVSLFWRTARRTPAPAA